MDPDPLKSASFRRSRIRSRIGIILPILTKIICYFAILYFLLGQFVVDYICFSIEKLKMPKKYYFKPKFCTQNLSFIDLAYSLGLDPDPEWHQNDADPQYC